MFKQIDLYTMGGRLSQGDRDDFRMMPRVVPNDKKPDSGKRPEVVDMTEKPTDWNPGNGHVLLLG